MFKSRTLKACCLVFLSIFAAEFAWAQQDDQPTPLSTARLILAGMDKDSNSLENAQLQIIAAYCRRQDFANALEMVNQVNRSQRVQVLSYLGKQALAARDTTTTKKVLQITLDLLPDVDDEDNSDFWKAPELVDLSLATDDPEMALKFIAKSERGARKAKALVKLAEYFNKQGDKEKTVRYLESALSESPNFETDEADYLLELTMKAATELAKLGLTERAEELTKRAQDLVESGHSSELKGGLALMFARMGEYSQAVSIMESMSDQKLGTMISMSIIYKNAGDERTALALITEACRLGLEKERDRYSESRNAKALAEAYLKLDRGDEAFELLPRIIDDNDLRIVAIALADWFQARERTNDARFTLDVARKRISKIVSEKSGDIPGSASTSRAQQKSHELLALAEAYGRISDPIGAERASRAIDHPQYRASALALAASSFAKAGDSSKAAELLTEARRLSDKAPEYHHDTFRESALYRMVKSAGDAGLTNFASDALEQFLRTLVKNDSYDSQIGTLFEMGLEIEAAEIPISKQSRSLLKQISARAREDQ